MNALITAILKTRGPSTARAIIKAAGDEHSHVLTKKETNKLLYAGAFVRVGDDNPPVWDVAPGSPSAAASKELVPGLEPADAADLKGTTVAASIYPGAPVVKILMALSKRGVADLTLVCYGGLTPADADRDASVEEAAALGAEFKEATGMAMTVTVIRRPPSEEAPPPRLELAALRKQLADRINFYVAVGDTLDSIATREIIVCEALGVPVVRLEI